MITREEIIKIKNSKYRFILHELNRCIYGIYRCLILLSYRNLKDDRKNILKSLKYTIKHLFKTIIKIFKPYNRY